MARLFLVLIALTLCAGGRLSAAPPHSVMTETSVAVPPMTPEAKRYTRTVNTLAFVRPAWGMLILWGVLATGVSARFRDRVARLPARLRLPAYYGLLTLLLGLLGLPLSLYGGYVVSHQYGLSHQPFWGWLGDWLSARALGYAINLGLLALLLWLIGRFPDRWPDRLWAVSVPLIALAFFLEPLVIEPLFNRFTPLPPGPLKTEIHRLAAKAGIPNAPILISDQSRRTETTNAYVTGIGPSARIVLWDTTVRQMPQDQIVAILGHEMGHYVLKHLYWGFLLTIIALWPALWAGKWAADRLIARFGPRWRLSGPNDLAAVPLILLLITGADFLTAPLTNAVSRAIEHQADAYGRRVTGDGPAMARAFVFFARHDLDDPNPPFWIKVWLYDHPPLGERIAYALQGR